MKLFGELSRRYGADMLAGSYNKLRGLVAGVKATEKDESADLLQWALQALLVQLLREEAKPSQFTSDTFSKGKVRMARPPGYKCVWANVQLCSKCSLS